MATEITGSGKFKLSRTTGLLLSHKVSPVYVFLSPTAAAISPADTEVISSLLSACILRSLPTLSVAFFVGLKTGEPEFKTPE